MLSRVRSCASAAAVQRALLPQAVVIVPLPQSVATCTTSRSLFTRSAVLAPPPRKEKTPRKKAAADSEADADAPAPTLDSAAAAAAAVSAPRKSAKVSAATAAAAPIDAAQSAERKAQGKATEAPLSRRDKMSVENVIEKEVPLMDLTGLTPGQNKFADVLSLLREQNYPAEVISDLEQVGDLATGSTAEILSGRLANLRAKYGRMPHDTGSPEVQVAMLTERLKGYERHQQVHRADIANRRGFLATWHRRRKLLKYLRRTRYETYAYMMRELQLRESDIDNYGLDRKSATQAPRIKRD